MCLQCTYVVCYMFAVELFMHLARIVKFVDLASTQVWLEPEMQPWKLQYTALLTSFMCTVEQYTHTSMYIQEN